MADFKLTIQFEIIKYWVNDLTVDVLLLINNNVHYVEYSLEEIK